MSQSDIEDVLRNWIDQAVSSSGQLAAGIDPAAWIANNFVAWWRKRIGETLGDAESATARLGDELKRHGLDGMDFSEVLHELTHVQDSLGDLRRELGLLSTAG